MLKQLQLLNFLIHDSQPYFFYLMAGESLLFCLAAILSVAYVFCQVSKGNNPSSECSTVRDLTEQLRHMQTPVECSGKSCLYSIPTASSSGGRGRGGAILCCKLQIKAFSLN